MQYVRLGRSGLKVSRLCLGCMTYGAPTERWPWALDEQTSRPFLQRALELGFNFFDTANMYSAGKSEEVLGRALKDFAKRDDVVIATKVFSPMGTGPNDMGLSRKHVMSQIDASLTRLGTDYIDLYQIHRLDSKTPPEEIMETLHDLVRSGKVRYIGASSMWAWQFSKLQYTAKLNGWTPFISMQPHYNLVYREEEREMLPLCDDMGVGVIPWSPLARGFLAGNRSRAGAHGGAGATAGQESKCRGAHGGAGATASSETTRATSDAFAKELYYQDDDFAVVDKVTQIAQARNVPNTQIALAWLLSKRVITAPIVGATKMHHLDDAVAALDLKLSSDEIKALEAPYRPHEVKGHR